MDEFGVVAGPREDANYAARFQKTWRSGLKPIEVVQPPCQVIPAAVGHERLLLVQESTILSRLTGERPWGT